MNIFRGIELMIYFIDFPPFDDFRGCFSFGFQNLGFDLIVQLTLLNNFIDVSLASHPDLMKFWTLQNNILSLLDEFFSCF